MMQSRARSLPNVVGLLALGTLFALPLPADAATIILSWDRNPEPEVTGYLVYVGSAPGVYSQSFDVGNQTTFVYSQGTSGTTYYFAVAAYAMSGPWRNLGSRSSEISATLPGSPPTPGGPGPGAPGGGGPLCTDATNSTCYSVQRVTSGLGQLSSSARVPDGRLFFIENGDRVRVLSGGTVVPEIALGPSQSGSSLRALAVDPAFNTTHFLFVSEIATLPDGTRELTIVRYRELQNRLGEGAAVVTGLPLPPQGEAPFTFDGAGRLYIAMPEAPRAAASRFPYGGFVLRYNQDGTLPSDNQNGSPIFARGYSGPTALEWDELNGQLWLAGTGEWSHTVSILDVAALGGSTWPLAARPLRIERSGVRGPLPVRALALAGGSGPGTPRTVLVVDSSGALYGAPVSQPGALLTVAPFDTGIPGQLLDVDFGSGQDALLPMRGPAPEGSSILRLQPTRTQ